MELRSNIIEMTSKEKFSNLQSKIKTLEDKIKENDSTHEIFKELNCTKILPKEILDQRNRIQKLYLEHFKEKLTDNDCQSLNILHKKIDQQLSKSNRIRGSVDILRAYVTKLKNLREHKYSAQLQLIKDSYLQHFGEQLTDNDCNP